MFGNRKKISQEEYDRAKSLLEQSGKILEECAAKKGVIEGEFSELQESREQMEVDLNQVSENIGNVSDYARQTIDMTASLSHTLDQYREDMQKAEQEYSDICGQIGKIAEDSQRLVEENKHFTSPSKYMSEAPAVLREQNTACFRELDVMGDYGKQMGVLALNAAIEAGRMGESGRQFVNAAEDIRTFSMKYEESVKTLRSMVEGSNERIAELEETVHHLVGLLKENNIAASKLMKSCRNNQKKVEDASIRSFSADVTSMKEQLTGIRNMEEELLKCEERNRMRVSDIEEEVLTQQKSTQELRSEIEPVLIAAARYKKQR